MKYLPMLAVAAILPACAMQPNVPESAASMSTKAPREVAQCIAKTWADQAQQPVVSQTTIANDVGIDVFVPGQPPGGAAAVVRPQPDGKGSWVAYRAADGALSRSTPAGDVSACL